MAVSVVQVYTWRRGSGRLDLQQAPYPGPPNPCNRRHDHAATPPYCFLVGYDSHCRSLSIQSLSTTGLRWLSRPTSLQKAPCALSATVAPPIMFVGSSVGAEQFPLVFRTTRPCRFSVHKPVFTSAGSQPPSAAECIQPASKPTTRRKCTRLD